MTQDEYKELKAGDVVKLISGSPDMTVSSTNVSFVKCDYWDDSKKQFLNVTFPFNLLSKVEKGN